MTEAAAGEFRLAELTFPAGFRQPRLSPERGYLALVLAGALEKTFPGRTRELHVDEMATIPAEAAHTAAFGREGARVLVVMPPPGGRILRELRVRSGGGFAALGRRIAAELAVSDAAAPVAAEGLALQLVAATLRSEPARLSPTPPPWLRGVVDRLHDRASVELATCALAAEAGVHPAHLGRVFRKHYGVPVATYVRQLRLERAAGALARTSTPVAQIAADEGFADQSHFTRAFKQYVGLTPARYRRSTQG